MRKLVIGSMHRSAGKTSLITGLARALNKKTGYLKPFGDRTFFHKKRLWDYDSALINSVFNLKSDLSNMTIGIEHSKLKYVYDENRIKTKLLEMVARAGESNELIFVEGGRDLSYGSSVYLDVISLAKYMDGELIIVVSGDGDMIMDDIIWGIRYINFTGVKLGGIIINKVDDLEDFDEVYQKELQAMGVNILGIIPYEKALSFLSIDDIAGFLFARVIAGEEGLKNVVENIFVGVMKVESALKNPSFLKKNNLIITTADRTDLIFEALKIEVAGIILTNNIMPSEEIIQLASEQKIPLLLAPTDTYEVEKKLNIMEPLLTKGDFTRINLLEELINEYMDVASFFTNIANSS